MFFEIFLIPYANQILSEDAGVIFKYVKVHVALCFEETVSRRTVSFGAVKCLSVIGYNAFNQISSELLKDV